MPHATRRPVREIMRNLQNLLLDPTNPQDGFTYARVFTGFNGYEIMEAKTLGWEIVKDTDPEDLEHKAPDGTRLVADTILMKIPNERKEEIDEYIKEKNYRNSGRAEDEALNERIASRGVTPVSFGSQAELQNVINNRRGGGK